MTSPPLRDTRRIERALGDAVRARLPGPLAEFVMFGLKMGWAALFGGLLLAALILTRALWQNGWTLHRYDALLAFALAVQVAMLRFRLETFDEARVILLFHLTGTVMEWFKVAHGSWSYPEPGLFKVLDVPLFSGFMYASVGSFMARAIRIFGMRFAPFPPQTANAGFAVLIYLNFFTHHFIADLRLALFAGSAVLFARTRVWFTVAHRALWMPLPLAAFLSAIFLWVAENIGTGTGTWLYAGQSMLDRVGFGKLGSWYLLLFVSFATVLSVERSAVSRVALSDDAARQM